MKKGDDKVMKIRIKGGTVISALVSIASIGIGFAEKHFEKKRVNAEIAKEAAKAVTEALAKQAGES